MGYTHYWYRAKELPQDLWNEFISDVNFFVIDSPMSDGKNVLAEEYDKPENPPIINESEIRFNGKEGGGHETFYLERVIPEHAQPIREEKFFNFCKTAHKPYDKYVVEVLSLAEMRFGDLIEISSDGDWEKIKVHCEREKA